MPTASTTDLARLGAHVRAKDLITELLELAQRYPQTADEWKRLRSRKTPPDDAIQATKDAGFPRMSKALQAQWAARNGTPQRGQTKIFVTTHWAALKKAGLHGAPAIKEIIRLMKADGIPTTFSAANSAYYAVKRQRAANGKTITHAMSGAAGWTPARRRMMSRLARERARLAKKAAQSQPEPPPAE